MKVLIEIDDKDYADIMSDSERNLNHYERLIKKGTPLPKGHGRLIDADELKKHKYHDNNRFENAVAVAQIDWADTIIEVDRKEQE